MSDSLIERTRSQRLRAKNHGDTIDAEFGRDAGDPIISIASENTERCAVIRMPANKLRAWCESVLAELPAEPKKESFPR